MEERDTPSGPASRAGAAAFVAAGVSLAAERALAELLPALRAADADAIAIKGPLQARWLYGTPRRPSVDLDLLVAPSAVPRAGAALRGLGYRPYLDPGDGTGTGYAQTWNKDGGVTVDLHWSLAGADRERLWPTLDAASETASVGIETVRIPTVPGRALVLALHAAQHGPEEPHVADDLARALAIVGDEGWREAAALARRAGAGAAFAAGLRTLPQGRALAAALALPSGTTPELEIRRAGEPHTALAFRRLAGTRDARAKAKLLARELAPPAAFMRDKYPIADHGPAGLALAYLYRPLWLARWAPRGYLAWRRARKIAEALQRADRG